MVKKQFFLFLLLSIWCFSISAQDQEPNLDSEYATKVITLINVSGQEELLRNSAAAPLQKLKKLKPKVPASVWEQLATEAKDMSLNNIYEKLVPMYQAIFSEKELKKIIKLYKKPLGQKVAKSFMPMQQAILESSQSWGKELETHFGQRLAEEGY